MNIDELLQPISAALPCGADLSFSAAFDQIAELRREDDPTLDQGAWVTALKVADWSGVLDRCGSLLREQSKDLRLAMWWAEAAALTTGYAGLHRGLVLCARLTGRYWDDGLHPQPEDGDVEQRGGNLRWFLGRLQALATLAPVARGRGGAYSLRQWAAAQALHAAHERSPDKPLPPEAVTLDQFHRALRETPQEDLHATLASIEGCLQALGEWQAVVDSKLGAEGPSFVGAREALATALHEVQRLARDAGALERAADRRELAHDGAAPAPSTPSVAGRRGASLSTREEALAQLREVAAFFRTTEPHSPVAYLADKAALWGDMPLHLWLRAVLKDGGALAHVEELLGVAPPPAADAQS